MNKIKDTSARAHSTAKKEKRNFSLKKRPKWDLKILLAQFRKNAEIVFQFVQKTAKKRNICYIKKNRIILKSLIIIFKNLINNCKNHSYIWNIIIIWNQL